MIDPLAEYLAGISVLTLKFMGTHLKEIIVT